MLRSYGFFNQGGVGRIKRHGLSWGDIANLETQLDLYNNGDPSVFGNQDPAQYDKNGLEGWYYKNSSSGDVINWYFFSDEEAYGAGAQRPLGDLTHVYARLLLYSSVIAPRIDVYTKPQNDGSDATADYRSFISYVANDLSDVYDNNEILLWGITEPTISDIQTLKATKDSATEGPQEDTEEIQYIVLASSSSVSAEVVEFLLREVGWIFNTTEQNTFVLHTSKIAKYIDVKYSPTYYTPTHDDLSGHLEGMDIGFAPKMCGPRSFPAFSDDGGGDITISSAEYISYTNSTFDGDLVSKSVSDTTLTLSDDTLYYVIYDYNAGSPVITTTTTPSDINHSNVLLIYIVARIGGEVYKLNDSLHSTFLSRWTDRLTHYTDLEIKEGLYLKETGSRHLQLSSGKVWYGTREVSLGSVDSSSASVIRLFYHSAGSWVNSTSQTFDNAQYDDGADLQGVSSEHFAVNWVYRPVDDSGTNELWTVLGDGDYTLRQAQETTPPVLPSIVRNMCVFVGKIIVMAGHEFPVQINRPHPDFSTPSVVSGHNDNYAMQGGTTGEYYHLTEAEHTFRYKGVNTYSGDFIINPGHVLLMDSTSEITATLPTTCMKGTKFKIVGRNTGGWKIAQNSGQIIHFKDTSSATGTSGYLRSNNGYDIVTLTCTVDDTEWVAESYDSLIINT